jgi:hypothetical protein
MGAAEWQPGVDLDAAIKQADIALYEAKAAGRNQLIAVTPDQSGEDTGADLLTPEFRAVGASESLFRPQAG